MWDAWTFLVCVCLRWTAKLSWGRCNVCRTSSLIKPMANLQCLRFGFTIDRGSPDTNFVGESNPTHLERMNLIINELTYSNRVLSNSVVKHRSAIPDGKVVSKRKCCACKWSRIMRRGRKPGFGRGGGSDLSHAMDKISKIFLFFDGLT